MKKLEKNIKSLVKRGPKSIDYAKALSALGDVKKTFEDIDQKLLESLNALEASTKNISRLLEVPGHNSELFKSIMQCSEECKTAFVRWRIAEDCFRSTDIDRLAAAMLSCKKTIEKASRDPRLEAKEKIISHALERINRRINLLDIFMTKGDKAFQQTLSEDLNVVLAKPVKIAKSTRQLS